MHRVSYSEGRMQTERILEQCAQEDKWASKDRQVTKDVRKITY